MAKRRGGAIAVCPQHPGSHVVCHERRQTKRGVRHVFRCRPLGSSDWHRFAVAIAGDVPVPLWSPPPACPEHPAGKVVRDGRYGRSTEKPRQRYRCYPDPGNREVYHRFTPWLPRHHVHTGEDRCDACEELRGTHRGEQSVSRRQSWSARVVAESLRDLARGGTYADVSSRAREVTERTRSRTGAVAAPARSSRERKNAWHTAADWVESFGPVLWDHTEAQLRVEAARAIAERDRLRAAGERNPKPVTIVIDDVPIHTKWVEPDSRKRSSRMIYSVLVVTEIRWHERPGGRLERQHKLRLVRACPANDHLAWKLVLHELGYVPDFIISDADDGQLKAIRDLYAAEALPPVVIPSMFHVRLNVEEGLKESPGAFHQEAPRGPRELRSELSDHLALLSRQQLTRMSLADWCRWWDGLEVLLVAARAALEPTRVRRQIYEPAVAAVLPTVAAFPQLPLSTGGIEVAIRHQLDPVLDNRAHSFANLERTNRLLDLVVCDDHGLFSRMPEVIELIRRDSAAADGWGSPLRMVTDPQPAGATRGTGRYSSLRDQLLLRELARARGLP